MNLIRNVSSSLKCKKLFKLPCTKILQQLSKLRLRKPLLFRHHKLNNNQGRFRLTKNIFKFKRPNHHKDRVASELQASYPELSSMHHQKAPQSSPLTPAYIRMSGNTTKREVVVRLSSSEEEEEEESYKDDVVEGDESRRFEKHLIEMIVEEGRMGDLVDVEELLYCWKKLKSPVFIDLVCRFYGELSKDWFSSACKSDIEILKGLLLK